jgi:1-acyl-sn-glycerol-3-phosphate acyltransferase
MLSFLPAPVTGFLSALLIITNTILCCLPLFLFSIFKLIIPIRGWQTFWSKVLIVIAETWMSINNFLLDLFLNINWHVSYPPNLKKEGWYLVVSNHQTWVDIPALQKALNHRTPMLKFFLKQQLIWVPVLGIAWWALDFPFMRRYSKEQIAKNPALKGKDIETTRKACEKFQYTPVSVMNFLEGTRFTQYKHDKQNSPFENLLRPKAGGVAFVLSAMGGQIKSMLDVTIVYQEQDIGFWDLLSGRIKNIHIEITEREIPPDLLQGDYENDMAFRENFQQWISTVWQEKDEKISEMKRSLQKN